MERLAIRFFSALLHTLAMRSRSWRDDIDESRVSDTKQHLSPAFTGIEKRETTLELFDRKCHFPLYLPYIRSI